MSRLRILDSKIYLGLFVCLWKLTFQSLQGGSTGPRVPRGPGGPRGSRGPRDHGGLTCSTGSKVSSYSSSFIFCLKKPWTPWVRLNSWSYSSHQPWYHSDRFM